MRSITNEIQNSIARKIGISKRYLCDILKGRRGCNQEVKNKIIFYYPELKFDLLNPRYILKEVK